MALVTYKDFCVDAVDAERIGRFWVEVLGATVIDAGSFPWTVMADPEGNEFCAFVRPDTSSEIDPV